jgi:MYXO-CTERM domain-containing protein
MPVAAAGPAVPGGSFAETSTQVEGSDPSTSVEAPAGSNEPIFEPDVPLAAEVNREAGGGPRKGVIAGVAGAFALLGAVLLRRRR